MSVLQKGDKVIFTDKFGIRQTGEFDSMKEIDGFESAVVKAKAFADMGDDTEVNCLVPLSALRKL